MYDFDRSPLTTENVVFFVKHWDRLGLDERRLSGGVFGNIRAWDGAWEGEGEIISKVTRRSSTFICLCNSTIPPFMDGNYTRLLTINHPLQHVDRF